MKTIPLTKGYEAIVDDEDYEELSKYKWQAEVGKCGHVYARRTVKGRNGKKLVIRMHRLILGVTDRKVTVDHINRDTLLNTKENLRVATHSQNCANKPSSRGGSSKYKGVLLIKRAKSTGGFYSTWRARIKVEGKNIHIGVYNTEREAAEAYNKSAVKHFGEYANLNVIANEA